jgi:ribokinase
VKVLNCGSLNIDYVYEVDHFVKAGETQASKSLTRFCGGKGLNQSIALSKCGVEVWHAGAVGEKDSDMLLEELNCAGVNTELIIKKQCNSGHTIIQKEPSGQNCILLYGGANQAITKNDVDHALTNFEKGDYLILQNEISQIGYIMEKAHQKGMKIVFNPSPMNELISTYPLEKVDFFLLNEIEAQEICRESGTGEELIEKIADRFPKAQIVLTLGTEGSIYKDADIMLYQAIYTVKAVDTTAAGDTYTGYFIGSLMKGETIEKALEYASKASAISVTKHGAGPSIPSMEEVHQL